MSTTPTGTTPPKRGRGRPKTVREDAKIFDAPGSKMERLTALYEEWYGCQRCDLCKFRMNDDIVFGEGNPDAHVLVVGEAPGEEEEATSLPFIGKSGKLMNNIIAMCSDNPDVRQAYADFTGAPRRGKSSEKWDEEFHKYMFEYRNREFFITNAISCRPPENRPPTPVEVEACWERLWNIIYIVDPIIIIAAGNTALAAMMRKTQVQITKMRGHVFDVSHQGLVAPVTYPVFPVFHPSYLLRKADWKVAGGDFEKTIEDWRKAMRVLDFLRNKHYGTPIPQRW